MTDTMERRTFTCDERRIEDAVVGKAATIEGHASVFTKDSEVMQGFEGPFVERIRPGAFKRTLRENPDIRAFVEHDRTKVLGRTTAGTLDVREDSTGLKVSITPPATTFGQDLVTSIRRGDIDQMSFGFRAIRDEFLKTDDGEPDVRELIDVDLFEVSAVAFPAYPDTDVAVRSYNVWKGNEKTRAKLKQQAKDIASLEPKG